MDKKLGVCVISEFSLSVYDIVTVLIGSRILFTLQWTILFRMNTTISGAVLYVYFSCINVY